MVIDFDKIAEESIMNFKGGHGELLTRNYVDGKCKIMMSCLRPGASSGLHMHEGNCEIVYVIFPDMVLSTSRRTVPVARFIKKQNPGTKLIQLMHPGRTGLREFDLAIVPEHHCGE